MKKMKTWHWVEKNGNAVMTISEETKEEAINIGIKLLKELKRWTLEEVDNEDD